MHARRYELKTLKSDILLGESPRWHQGRLWFADWVAETLYAVDTAGNCEVVTRIASLPFSIDWLPDGRLLVVNAREQRLMRQETDGTFVTHADLSGLSQFPSNEIVVDARGNAYVNNINHEFGGEFAPGLIALVTPDGTVRQVAEGLGFPNGMAITADGRTLICAESYAKQLTAFDIAEDGSLSNQRVWAGLDGHPDGICMDVEGSVWSSLGNKCVRVREGGEIVETIDLDRMAFACMLGGDDGRTLFICAAQWTGAVEVTEATGRLYATRVAVPHAGYPRA
jgi:sugar lactone lactonase YvrE